MEQPHEQVLKCYDREGLEATILQALEGQFGDLSQLRPDDLASIDEFHIRGRDATVELAGLVGDLAGRAVLDIGCGLGGTARYLASKFGCRVTGVDITPTYIDLAKKLSQAVGLAEETSFHEASALKLPFASGAFDVIWMEHLQMNIPQKDRLALQIARVLREDGTLALHEVFAVAGAEPHFPVPWADVSSGSFLVSPEDFRSSLEEAGLKAIEWRDVSQPSSQWFTTLTQRLAESGPPPLGLHLLMGESARTKLGNVKQGLEENRICVVQAVYRKASPQFTA